MKNPDKKTLALYFLAIAVNLIFLFKYFPTITSHSESIYNYIESYINENPTLTQMKGYSILKTIIDILVGTPLLLTSVCISQSVMLIIAIKGFGMLSKAVIDNKYLVYFTLLIFATHPSLSVSGNNVLTDSFAMAGLIFFIVNLQRIVRKPENKRLFPLIFNMFFLSFLRSTLIFLIPVGIITSIYMYIKKRNKVYIYSLAGSIFILLLHIGVYFVKEDINSKEIYTDNITINNDLNNYDTVDNIHTEIIHNDAGLLRITERFFESAHTNLSYSDMKDVSVFDGIIFRDYYKIPVKMGIIYIMMAIYLLYIIYKYVRLKEYNRTEILLWSFVAFCMILMIADNSDQYNRLIMPVVPLILILGTNIIKMTGNIVLRKKIY